MQKPPPGDTDSSRHPQCPMPRETICFTSHLRCICQAVPMATRSTTWSGRIKHSNAPGTHARQQTGLSHDIYAEGSVRSVCPHTCACMSHQQHLQASCRRLFRTLLRHRSRRHQACCLTPNPPADHPPRPWPSLSLSPSPAAACCSHRHLHRKDPGGSSPGHTGRLRCQGC